MDIRVPTPGESVIAAPTSPAVRQALREQGLVAAQVAGSGVGGRIVMSDLSGIDAAAPVAVVQQLLVKSEESPVYQAARIPVHHQPISGEERVKMSPLRKRIAERLLQAQHQTVTLTTFNEVDLGALQALRASRKRAGQPVGLLPFFVKAAVEALTAYPTVNARIEGDEIVYHHFQHLGVTVPSDKGLVVPVLRNADRLSLLEIDGAITGFLEQIKTNLLATTDQEGGTFTISNGGSPDSMFSTPIINPPQSGVLGMHVIQDRPVARGGWVVIRPMMYLALSYDHRIIDGPEAEGFLKIIKERLEDAGWLAGL